MKYTILITRKYSRHFKPTVWIGRAQSCLLFTLCHDRKMRCPVFHLYVTEDMVIRIIKDLNLQTVSLWKVLGYESLCLYWKFALKRRNGIWYKIYLICTSDIFRQTILLSSIQVKVVYYFDFLCMDMQ